MIPTHRVAKPWGVDALPAAFAAQPGERIGEIWFDPPPALEEILVKYLFTSEALSVQTHPSDGNSPSGRGKEECWFVLDAEPGARLAIGLTKDLTREELAASARDGTIEDLLAWHHVEAGDFFYVPAGTVHAIGAGITLVEVQQNCGLTYRLYDYGRPRELHLDEAVAVSLPLAYPPELHRKVASTDTTLLVAGPHFCLAHVSGGDPEVVSRHFPHAIQIIPLSGNVSVGGLDVVPGQSAWCDALGDIAAADDARWLVCAPSADVRD